MAVRRAIEILSLFLYLRNFGYFSPWKSKRKSCIINVESNRTAFMKTKLKLLGPVLLAVVLGGMVGCKTSSESGRTAGRVLDDDNVTTKVETALRDAPTYKFDGVKVSTFDGLVQLSGWVASPDQKAAAEQITRGVYPSQKIYNNISVIEPAPQPRAVGGTTDTTTTTTTTTTEPQPR